MDNFKTGGYCPSCLHASGDCTCIRDFFNIIKTDLICVGCSHEMNKCTCAQKLWEDLKKPDMNEKLKDVDLIDELRETMEDVQMELKLYEQHNGDVWKQKGLDFNGVSQEERFLQKVMEYITDWKELGVPVPWAKLIGDAHIAFVRERKLK